MNICKKCGKILTAESTYPSDPRYCLSCAQQRRITIAQRRTALYGLLALPLNQKVELSKHYIQEAINEFGESHVYIAFSGGKDSTVLSHIAKEICPTIVHIFADTSNEYPETLEQVEWEKNENGTNIIIVKPIDRNGEPWTFKRVVEHYGYPLFSKRVANAIRTYRHALFPTTKQHSIDYINRNFKKYDKYKECNISDKCCEVLKKNPIKKKAKELGMKCSILGILASESYQRQKEWINYGCNVFYKKSDNQCRPLMFWTESDIYKYIEQNNIKISSLYDKGYSRNGCMYCGFGVHLEKDGPNRFQMLKQTHPAQYTYFVENFGSFIIDFDIAIC